jgi:LAO/AO transport system kinase
LNFYHRNIQLIQIIIDANCIFRTFIEVESPDFVKQQALLKVKLGKNYFPETSTLLQGILSNDRILISRAITLIESQLKEHRSAANWLIEACLPHRKPSLRIGITGVPGVGKSTFINQLTGRLLQEGHKVAILAVDPSSSQTGGSILGDKTRMEDIFSLPNVLIRPTPAGNTLGGVARATRETILICEAAGFDRILIETVGVGQSETAVHSMTDLFLLLMLPGAGDELQGIKRGIMEMADILVVHKCDGSNVDKAKIAAADYSRALHLFPTSESGWIPRVLKASSSENTGFEEIISSIQAFELQIKTNGYFEFQRKQQNSDWFKESLREQMFFFIENDAEVRALYEQFKQKVVENEVSPFKAAEEIMNFLLSKRRG